MKQKKILENKTTNAITWKEKIEAWEKIHAEFNSATEGPSRAIKTLRTKYDSMKKEVRKLVARQRKYVTDTGGGPFKGQEKLSPALEQPHQNIKPSSDASMLQATKPKELKYVREQSLSTEIEIDQVPNTSAPLFEKSSSYKGSKAELEKLEFEILLFKKSTQPKFV